MLIYGLQRVGLAALICVTSMCVLFGAFRLIPGDLATIMLGPRATEEMRANLNRDMGLDRPLPMQLAKFLGGAVRGYLGTDPLTKHSVGSIIVENLPYTLVLMLSGLTWSALVGIPLGCYSAIRRNSWIDRLTGVLSVGTISIPSFVVAIYALLFFAIQLKWFPVIGAGEQGDLRDQLWHLVLPSFAVGLGWVGYLSRLVRASMLEVMGENHIRTARAFGLPETKIILQYALRIAILPTVTMLALAIGSLFSSAVFAENIFSRPGLGKVIVDSAFVHNYPVVQGAVLTTVVIFVFLMPISDFLVAWMDPRVRSTL
ncbi:ABC transporter permease [Mesorhizobium sp. M0924]|uniref:ABC transporter permease n=1 Tax=unclassified Mesorhizobium TaxID=325217 RepID=UPI00333CAFD3